MSGQGTGGFAKVYCSDTCRGALHGAARRWALAALDAGLVTVQTFRTVAPARRSRRALAPRRAKPPPTAPKT